VPASNATDVLVLIGAGAGAAWGLAADRLAARWPAHPEGSPAVRPVDWRTPIVILVGGVAAGLTLARFGPTPVQLALMAIVVALLIVMFATDLDQRLLPDVLTLPLIPIALAAFGGGASPYLHQPIDLVFAVAAGIIVPLGLYLLAIPFGAGAIGLGDLKLLVGIGLLGGAWRLLAALVSGAILAAVVILVLVALRRITLRSYVPYGPFLIIGSLWALLVLSDTAPL
jgi:leader peptidase (prepilin peptidase)/N-methyltransferase